MKIIVFFMLALVSLLAKANTSQKLDGIRIHTTWNIADDNPSGRCSYSLPDSIPYTIPISVLIDGKVFFLGEEGWDSYSSYVTLPSYLDHKTLTQAVFNFSNYECRADNLPLFIDSALSGYYPYCNNIPPNPNVLGIHFNCEAIK